MTAASLRLGWPAASLALALAPAGCSRTTPGGGLELLLGTDLSVPADFDQINLYVAQQVGDADGGQWNTLFMAPVPTTLPASFSIAAGKSPDQVALIEVTLLKVGMPVVFSEVQVQVPTNRVAELRMVLARSCYGQVQTVGGMVMSSCPAGQSCQAATGMCGSDLVDPSGLSSYNPGDLGDLDASAGPPADAGPMCSGNMCIPVVDAGPACTSGGLPPGATTCTYDSDCCQTGADIPLGAACWTPMTLASSQCAARCNATADCPGGSCCVANAGGLPTTFGQAPTEPGGVCVETASLGEHQCMAPGAPANAYVCDVIDAGYDCSPEVPSAPPTGCNWTGMWTTQGDGTMTLVQSGSSVSGDYSTPLGEFTGTVSGNVLSGSWTQVTASGVCAWGPQTMTINAACDSFKGTYSYCQGEFTGGAVIGTRP